MAATFTSIQATCPNTCTWKGAAGAPGGCYADAGFTAIKGQKLDAAGHGLDADAIIAAEAAAIDAAFRGKRVPQDGARGGRDLRLHVGGDITNAKQQPDADTGAPWNQLFKVTDVTAAFTNHLTLDAHGPRLHRCLFEISNQHIARVATVATPMPPGRKKTGKHRHAPDADAKRVGVRVRALRDEKGFTFDSFVEEVGLGRGYVSELERGLVVPSLHALKRVAAALEVTIADLVLGDTQRERLYEATRDLDDGDLRVLAKQVKAMQPAPKR